jgi:hypothetical protein
MSRPITIALLVILVLSSFITLQPALCTTKLSKPELTIAYTDYSYDTSAYPTTDPYTGKSVEVPAAHVENRTLQFMIKYKSLSSDSLHFVIRMKGHYSANWTAIYDGWANSSGPELTVWTFSTLRGHDLPGQLGYFYQGGNSFYVPAEGKMDFQVKAQTWGEVMATTSPTNPFGGSITTMFGESDWSSIQTINLGNGETETTAAPTPTIPTTTAAPSLGPTATPTTTPTPPNSGVGAFANLSWEVTALLAGLLAAVAVLAVGLVVLWRRVGMKTAI